MGELGLGVAQQGLVGVAHVLPALPGTTPVGMDDETGGGPLGQQCPLQGAGDQGPGHVGPHLPALPGTTHHVLGAQALKGAQVGPGPVGQQQASEARSPTPGWPGWDAAGRAASWGRTAARAWNRWCVLLPNNWTV